MLTSANIAQHPTALLDISHDTPGHYRALVDIHHLRKNIILCTEERENKLFLPYLNMYVCIYLLCECNKFSLPDKIKKFLCNYS